MALASVAAIPAMRRLIKSLNSARVCPTDRPIDCVFTAAVNSAPKKSGLDFKKKKQHFYKNKRRRRRWRRRGVDELHFRGVKLKGKNYFLCGLRANSACVQGDKVNYREVQCFNFSRVCLICRQGRPDAPHFLVQHGLPRVAVPLPQRSGRTYSSIYGKSTYISFCFFIFCSYLRIIFAIIFTASIPFEKSLTRCCVGTEVRTLFDQCFDKKFENICIWQ